MRLSCEFGSQKKEGVGGGLEFKYSISSDCYPLPQGKRKVLSVSHVKRSKSLALHYRTKKLGLGCVLSSISITQPTLHLLPKNCSLPSLSFLFSHPVRAAPQPWERSRGVRVGVVQLADLVRVQLRLHAHRRQRQALREGQAVDGGRAALQRWVRFDAIWDVQGQTKHP